MHELTNYDAAVNALAICVSIDEAKDIQDKSAAMQYYAKQANNTELEVYAAKVKLRAQRRLGELIAEMEKATNQVALPSGGKSKKDSLDDAGISLSTAHRFEKLAAIPEKDIENYIATSTAAHKPVTLAAAIAIIAPPKPKPATPPPVITPEPEPEPEEVQPETVTLLLEVYEELKADAERWNSIAVMLHGDQQLIDAAEEIASLSDQLALAISRRDGIMGEKNEAIKQTKYWKRKAEKLELELAGCKIKEVGL